MDNNIIDKRTKGEYSYTSCNDKDYIDIDCDGKRITSILINSDDDTQQSYEEIAEENTANAAFICKAVNNYDSLLNALKEVVAAFPVGQYNIKKDFSKLVVLAGVSKAIYNAENAAL